MPARRRVFVWFVFGVIFGIVGFATPRFFIDNGIDSYRSAVERRVAINSVKTAKQVGSGSPDAVLTTAYRVADVFVATEPCDGSPNMFLPDGNYASRVQTYTIFGFRYKSIYITCGGDSWSIFPRL